MSDVATEPYTETNTESLPVTGGLSALKRITFIGGGSYQWVPVLFRDLAVNASLQDARFVMHDIDTERNAELAGVCRTIARKVESNIRIETEDSLTRALTGADIVVLCISTGGLEAMAHDIEIPKKYGIYQPVGDSTGPGGISRTLRNVPVVVRIAKEMEKHCPQAWLLNLSNPMDQIVQAISRTTSIKVVGLCHEYMGFMGKAQEWLGFENFQKNCSATIAGINHFAWITQLDVNGEDGLEMLRRFHAKGGVSKLSASESKLVNLSAKRSPEKVKFQLFENYGVMPYPGDRHLVEFFPYFLSEKTQYGAAFGVDLTSIEDRRTTWMEYFMDRIKDWTSDDPASVPLQPSEESLAPIIAALLGGESTIQPVAVPNRGQVSNLPMGSVVETLGTFQRNLLSPHVSGPLPEALVALTYKHCVNQDLTVEAALTGNRERVLHAMLADPLNNCNDYREITAMLDELMEANRSLLPQFG
ncbi:MAG: hypothetical protein Q7Q73_06520 [Verrucomicrobiota bacterium JB024]|nr:hypothetical protein [Verrucomicrobiota bacterium JB024]